MPKKIISLEEKTLNKAVDMLIDAGFPVDQVEVFTMLPLSAKQLIEVAKKLIDEYKDEKKKVSFKIEQIHSEDH